MEGLEAAQEDCEEVGQYGDYYEMVVAVGVSHTRGHIAKKK